MITTPLCLIIENNQSLTCLIVKKPYAQAVQKCPDVKRTES